MKPKDGGGYLYVYQYKDHLGNVRLSYADLDGSGTIESGSEILEEKNYYPFGLQHDGYNMGVKDERSIEAEQIGYNGKEFEDTFELNMYEYGARSYDPALGRFFNMDNYAENYFDFTPYQYAANNPIYFIDVNGDYIYIYDRDSGKDLKYSNGKVYERIEGNWTEFTPEAGSFVAFVVEALNNIYNFSSGSGSTGGGGGAGAQLLSMFENDNINVTILDAYDTFSMRHDSGNIISGMFSFTLGKVHNSENVFESIPYFIALAHELAHGLSFEVLKANIRNEVWYERPNNNYPVTIDEIFATMIENKIRLEHKIPLRTHYMDLGTFKNAPSLFEQSRILDLNSQPVKEIMIHLNKYKESGLWKD